MPAPDSTSSLHDGLHVLVAEDDIISQYVAENALKRLGHTSVVVNDGDQALRCMEWQKFDLILMDHFMPQMSGLQAMAAIRSLEGRGVYPRTPIIMVTAFIEQADRERYLSLGADGYVPKPLQVDALHKEILRVKFPSRVLPHRRGQGPVIDV